jgi:hypothetical protein
VAESTLLRVKKLESLKGQNEIYRSILNVLMYDVAGELLKKGTDALNSFECEEEKPELFHAIYNLTKSKV